MSLVYVPPRTMPHPAALTIAAGLAVFDTVVGLGIEEARLDWPNDLMVGPAKLAGILVESRDGGRTFVIGIGLNVRQRSFSQDLLEERSVTSLALRGWVGGPDQVLDELLPHLGAQLDDMHPPARLERDFVEACQLGGGRVRVELSDRIVEGSLISLTLEEGLRVAQPNGHDQLLPLEHVRGLNHA